MKFFCILIFLLVFQSAHCFENDSLKVIVSTTFEGKKINLNDTLNFQNKKISFSTIKFYLSDFQLFKNKIRKAKEPNSYHLIDLDKPESQIFYLQNLQKKSFNHLCFKIGIDSLTNVSGDLDGDLDPTKGMYWTWQSGYINCKIEGFSEITTSRNHNFQYHLGGYLAPFQSVQKISKYIHKKTKIITIEFQLDKFLNQINIAESHSIMSPGKVSKEYSEKIKNAFIVYEK